MRRVRGMVDAEGSRYGGSANLFQLGNKVDIEGILTPS